MFVFAWADLDQHVIDFIRTEEWVGIPDKQKQRMLLDLEDPRNIEETLQYSEGCDMVQLKFYRPESPTKMSKFKKWIFILGIAEKLRQSKSN